MGLVEAGGQEAGVGAGVDERGQARQAPGQHFGQRRPALRQRQHQPLQPRHVLVHARLRHLADNRSDEPSKVNPVGVPQLVGRDPQTLEVALSSIDV